MFDPDLMKTLASLGVGGLLGGFIFMTYRKDSLSWQAAWKGQSEALLQVVKENTIAVTKLCERMEEQNERGRRYD